MPRRNNGRLIKKSGWFITIVALLILIIGYFERSLVVKTIQINLIPLGIITLILGILILIAYYISRQ